MGHRAVVFPIEQQKLDWAISGDKKMKFRELMKMIEMDGWKLNRQKGSHQRSFIRQSPELLPIAGKPGDDVPAGTLNSIKKQAGLK